MKLTRKITSLFLVFVMIMASLCLSVAAVDESGATFKITYNKPTGATIALSPEGDHSENDGVHTHTYALGTNVTLTVTADSGYELESVKANGVKLLNETGKTSFTYNVGFDDTTALIVTTTKLAPVKAEIKVNTDNNFTYTLEGADSESKADIGSTVVLKITPAEGFAVTEILYNGTSVKAGNEYSFTVGEKNEFAVKVEKSTPPETKKLTVNVDGLGSVTPENGDYEVGKDITLRFAAGTGNLLYSLEINGTPVPLSKVVSNKYIFKFTEDTTVNVVYKKSVVITVSLGTGGSITVNGTTVKNSGSVRVAEGEDIKVTVAPYLGYTLKTVKLDGTAITVDAENSFTIPAISKSKTVSATFTATTAKQYTVNASASEGGVITPVGSSVVEEGKNLTFTIQPDMGYEIDYVSDNGTNVTLENGEYKLIGVAGNHVIFVKFKQTTSPNEKPITAADINWNTDTVIIDISKNTKVSSDVFAKITSDCANKTVIFAADNYKWTIPAGTSIVCPAEYADLGVILNGGVNYDEITSLINEKVESIRFMLVSYSRSMAFPDNTLISVKLDQSLSGKALQQLIYNSSLKKLESPQQTPEMLAVSEDGWVTAPYKNYSDFIISEALDESYTIVATASAGGTITPSGTKSVAAGGDERFTITAYSGYVISSVLVDGQEVEDAKGKANFDKVFEKVSTNHTISVSFLLQQDFDKQNNDKNSSLYVSLIIVFLAVIGAAALFIIKWRQERY